MGREVVRNTQIPPFSDWVTARPGIEQILEPRPLQRLYAGVADQDMTVVRINGRYERALRVANLQVFYQSGDTTYRLRERRFTITPGLNPEEVLEQFMAGNESGVTPSRPRPDDNSLSERMKLNGETREHATIRALHEEMFDLALRRSTRKYPDLDRILEENLRYDAPRVIHQDAYGERNSFQGLHARYFLFPATITFTPDMDVPIELRDGVPQPLYEFADRKYINRYEWVKVA